jgi:hypothetical protein
MRILSVKTTQLPTGERIQWVSGMPKHSYRVMDSAMYNMWASYVHNQVHNIKPVNTVRPGGVCYSEGQESVLRLAKEILL